VEFSVAKSVWVAFVNDSAHQQVALQGKSAAMVKRWFTLNGHMRLSPEKKKLVLQHLRGNLARSPTLQDTIDTLQRIEGSIDANVRGSCNSSSCLTTAYRR